MLRCAGIYRSIKRLQLARAPYQQKSQHLHKSKKGSISPGVRIKNYYTESFLLRQRDIVCRDTLARDTPVSVFLLSQSHTQQRPKVTGWPNSRLHNTDLHHRLGLQCKVRDGNAFMVLSWSHDLVCVFFFCTNFVSHKL